MSVSHLLTTALLEAQSGATTVYGLTSGRLWSAIGAGVGLLGVLVGVLALVRVARRTGSGRRGAAVSVGTGLAGAVTGALVVAAAEGGPGTGYGIVGGYLSVVIGLVAVALGGLVLARARRTV